MSVVRTEARAPQPQQATASTDPGLRSQLSSDTVAVSSGPAEASEAVSPGGGDTLYSPGQEPRAVWVNDVGNVNVKVDTFQRDGRTPSLGVVFTVAGPGALPAGRFSKIYNTGTTATSLVALW
jgi:hypothetical protein